MLAQMPTIRSGMAAIKTLHEADVWELFDVASAAGMETLDSYLGQVLCRAASWFEACGASLFVRRQGTDIFDQVAVCGSHHNVPRDASVKSGEGIAGQAILRKEALLIGNPGREPELAGLPIRRRIDISSSMVVPLLNPEGDCVGVLNVARSRGSTSFSRKDLKHACSLGRLIALAVNNARLFIQLTASMNESRALHEMLQTVIESVGFGVVVISSNGRIEHMNPEATTLMGGISGAGSNWESCLQSFPHYFREPAGHAIANGLAGDAESRRVCDPATGRSYSLVSTPLTTGGVTLAIQELTEHERTREELARLKRLAEIGQMTATIAHEIRNPLTGIRAAAQMLRSSPEHAQEFSSIIEAETVKLNDLCDEFLEFAKPLVLNLEPCLLGTIAKQVCDAQMAQFIEKGVHLDLVIEPEEPKIMLDPRRIEQVCHNLLINALQASESGKRVLLKVAGNRLIVEDEGIGMPSEVLENLFTPFYTTKAKGTGLGLSNVRKILDAHGATIEVHSEPGQGSCFEISFKTENTK